MKIENLKIADSVRNKNPYPGEGERMIVAINYQLREFTVIVCMSEKLKNGTRQTIPFDVMESYYEKVDTTKAEGTATWKPSPGGHFEDYLKEETEYLINEAKDLDTVNSQLVDGLRKAMNEAADEEFKRCECSNRGIVHYRGRTLICMKCGGIIGEFGDLAFVTPYHPESNPIIKFDVVGTTQSSNMEFCECGDHAHFDKETGECYECGLFPKPRGLDGTLTFDDLKEKEAELEKWLNTKRQEAEDHLKRDVEAEIEKLKKVTAKRKSVLAIQQLIDKVRNFGKPKKEVIEIMGMKLGVYTYDGEPFWACDNWEWVWTWGRLEILFEIDVKSWQFLPHIGCNFRDEQCGVGWLVFSLTIDYGKNFWNE